MTTVAAPPPWGSVRPTSILDVLLSAYEAHPAKQALIFEDGVELTCAELVKRVEAFAGYLRPRLSAGERVAVMLGNRAEWLIAWFAVAGCRAIIVSLNPAAQEHDASHVLQDSSACMVITDGEHAPLIGLLQEQCSAVRDIIVVADDEPDGLAGYAAEPVPLKDLATNAHTDDPVNVYYTSGTTGSPKGCLVGHLYWLRFVDLFYRLYGMSPDDRILCCLQFFYNDPPWLTLVSLSAGTPLIVMRRFSVSRFWDVARGNDVTLLFGIASTANLLLKAPPSDLDRRHHVRLAVHVGVPAALHAQLVQRWGVPWVEAYGLTESGLVATMPLDDADRMVGSGSIGRPCPEVEIRLVDDTDYEVPPGDVGEIVLQAPGLMFGYLGRPEATAEAMRGGWFHTGDLAKRDEHGFLYFMGRKKDIVRRNGENIAASEVEQVLRSHPDILEAAVLPYPDELRGEEVHAMVLLVSGRSPQTTSPEAILEFCGHRLSKHKLPRFITYRNSDFPRSPSMRVRKQELLDSQPGWDREAASPVSPTAQPTEEPA